MLTRPPRRTYAGELARGRPGDPGELTPSRAFETWHFESGGAKFEVWDVPGEARRGPVVVLTHGWGDSKIGGLSRLNAVLPRASRVLMWDLRGHGVTPGPSMLGQREGVDLVSLLSAANAAGPVVLYGWSLGAMVSLMAAAGDAGGAVAGVIAQTPYQFAITPARNVMRIRRLPHALVLPAAMGIVGMRGGAGWTWKKPLAPAAAPFDGCAIAAKVYCPLLVLHGTEDEVTPLDDGRAIAKAAPRGRIVEVEGGRHNDLWSEPNLRRQCEQAIAAFLAETGSDV